MFLPSDFLHAILKSVWLLDSCREGKDIADFADFTSPPVLFVNNPFAFVAQNKDENTNTQQIEIQIGIQIHKKLKYNLQNIYKEI